MMMKLLVFSVSLIVVINLLTGTDGKEKKHFKSLKLMDTKVKKANIYPGRFNYGHGGWNNDRVGGPWYTNAYKNKRKFGGNNNAKMAAKSHRLVVKMIKQMNKMKLGEGMNINRIMQIKNYLSKYPHIVKRSGMLIVSNRHLKLRRMPLTNTYVNLLKHHIHSGKRETTQDKRDKPILWYLAYNGKLIQRTRSLPDGESDNDVVLNKRSRPVLWMLDDDDDKREVSNNGDGKGEISEDIGNKKVITDDDDNNDNDDDNVEANDDDMLNKRSRPILWMLDDDDKRKKEVTGEEDKKSTDKQKSFKRSKRPILWMLDDDEDRKKEVTDKINSKRTEKQKSFKRSNRPTLWILDDNHKNEVTDEQNSRSTEKQKSFKTSSELEDDDKNRETVKHNEAGSNEKMEASDTGPKTWGRRGRSAEKSRSRLDDDDKKRETAKHNEMRHEAVINEKMQASNTGPKTWGKRGRSAEKSGRFPFWIVNHDKKRGIVQSNEMKQKSSKLKSNEEKNVTGRREINNDKDKILHKRGNQMLWMLDDDDSDKREYKKTTKKV